MATGGETGELDPKSLVSGSEVIYDHTCQPCSEEEVKEAAGFCQDCNEWLCCDCYKFHKRSAASRNHVLCTTEEREKRTVMKVKDKCSEKCERHNKTIKYHCEDHNIFTCSACLHLDHRNCVKVHFIPEVSKDIDTSTEYLEFGIRLQRVVSESEQSSKDLKEKLETVHADFSEIIKDLQEQRQAINEKLDQLENDIRQQAGKCKDDIISRLKHAEETCISLKVQAEELINQVQKTQHQHLNGDTYIAINKNKDVPTILRKTMNELKVNKLVKRCRFTPKRNLLKELEQQNKNGGINKIPQQVHVTHQANINIKSSKERQCSAMGLVILPNKQLVLTDDRNQKVKLVCLENNVLIYEIGVPGRSWSLAKVDENTVAVTLPNIRKIIFVRVRNSMLYNERQLRVNGECWGICATNDSLIVGFLNPDKLEILNMNGDILRSLKVPMCEPCHIVLAPDDHTVYVSNSGDNTVSKITVDGSHMATFQDPQLDDPCQIALDKYGRVFVTSYINDTLHFISPGFKHSKIILNGELIKEPAGLCYCSQEEKLYVGMKNADHIKMFKLS